MNRIFQPRTAGYVHEDGSVQEPKNISAPCKSFGAAKGQCKKKRLAGAADEFEIVWGWDDGDGNIFYDDEPEIRRY